MEHFGRLSDAREIAERGQVQLTDRQVATLNQIDKEASSGLVNDRDPKFVVRKSLEMVAHPDSDHLLSAKCRWLIGQFKSWLVLQMLVSASSLIVALPGAMMKRTISSSQGELRGERVLV